jgi:hypothetical protein
MPASAEVLKQRRWVRLRAMLCPLIDLVLFTKLPLHPVDPPLENRLRKNETLTRLFMHRT